MEQLLRGHTHQAGGGAVSQAQDCLHLPQGEAAHHQGSALYWPGGGGGGGLFVFPGDFTLWTMRWCANFSVLSLSAQHV